MITMIFDIIIPISSFQRAKSRLWQILDRADIQKLLLLILDNLIIESYSSLKHLSANIRFHIFTPKENFDIIERNLKDIIELKSVSRLHWVFETDSGKKKDFTCNFDMFIKNFIEKTNPDVLLIFPCDLILFSGEFYNLIDWNADINIGNSQDNGTSFLLLKNNVKSLIYFGIQDSFKKNITEFKKKRLKIHLIKDSNYLIDADTKLDLFTIFEMFKAFKRNNDFQNSIYYFLKEKFDIIKISSKN